MEKEKRNFKLVVIFLAVSSFSWLLSFFGSYDEGIVQKIFAYAVPVLFWGMLIAGYAVLAGINRKRKKYLSNQSSKKSRENRHLNAKPGILCFASNPKAKLFDLIMAVSFVLSVIFGFIPILNKALCVVFESILIFSIHMHCILNGVNYRYINIVK